MKSYKKNVLQKTLDLKQDIRQNLISASEEAQQLLSDLNADRRN